MLRYHINNSAKSGVATSVEDFVKNPGGYYALCISKGKLNQSNVNALIDSFSEGNNILTFLDIRASQVDCRDIIRLLNAITNNSLNELYLDKNAIGDSKIDELSNVLRKFTNLSVLSLNHNQIGDYGAQKIASTFSMNNIIGEINLEHNNIGDQGAKAFEQIILGNILANRYELSRSTKYLNLEHNYITPETVQYLQSKAQRWCIEIYKQNPVQVSDNQQNDKNDEWVILDITEADNISKKNTEEVVEIGGNQQNMSDVSGSFFSVFDSFFS